MLFRGGQWGGGLPGSGGDPGWSSEGSPLPHSSPILKAAGDPLTSQGLLQPRETFWTRKLISLVSSNQP